MKSIAITGSNGLLGKSLVSLLAQYNYNIIGINWRSLLSTAESDFSESLRSKNIDVIIHCAALTNVELCEKDPLQSYYSNYLLTKKIVDLCFLNEIKIIFISSTGVYGNYQDQPYTEADRVCPTTYHHDCKYKSENYCRNLENHLIIRTGWLFGGAFDNPKNFISARIKEFKVKDSIFSDPFQYGNPTNVDDVSKAIYNLYIDGHYGTFNCVNTGFASRYEYVKFIADHYPKPIKIFRLDKPFKRLARVSHNEMAINSNLLTKGFGELRPWQEALAYYLKSLNL